MTALNNQVGWNHNGFTAVRVHAGLAVESANASERNN